MSHTPAPWSAFTDDSTNPPHTNVVAVLPHTHAVFSLPGHHKDEANIKLICAAPDLLAAAVAAVERLGELGLDGEASGLSAAIARATH